MQGSCLKMTHVIIVTVCVFVCLYLVQRTFLYEPRSVCRHGQKVYFVDALVEVHNCKLSSNDLEQDLCCMGWFIFVTHVGWLQAFCRFFVVPSLLCGLSHGKGYCICRRRHGAASQIRQRGIFSIRLVLIFAKLRNCVHQHTPIYVLLVRHAAVDQKCTKVMNYPTIISEKRLFLHDNSICNKIPILQ